MNNKTTPFVYRWDEISTGKWYIGAHYKKGCHPDDGYLCSSKIVKQLIQALPGNWKRTILEICETPSDAQFREAQILQSLNARMDPMSYNQTNADGKFSFFGPHLPETREKMKRNHPCFKGENNPMFGRQGGMKGKRHTEDSKRKTSAALKGRLLQEETIEKIKESLTGLVWINNGIDSRRIDLQEENLPDGWTLGMLPEHVEKLANTRRGERHWNYGKSHNSETKEKIAQSLIGRRDSEEVKLKKKLGNARRPKIVCDGCNTAYLACHKRFHLQCSRA